MNLDREARLAAKQAVDAELTRARTELVKLRSERDQITIGLRRGQLLVKQTAKLQLGFLLAVSAQALHARASAAARVVNRCFILLVLLSEQSRGGLAPAVPAVH